MYVGGLYATWLTFSALSSNPEISCNPFAGTNDATAMWVGVAFSAISIGYMGCLLEQRFLRWDQEGWRMLSGVWRCGATRMREGDSTRRLSDSSSMHAATAGDVEASSSDESSKVISKDTIPRTLERDS